MPPSVVIVAAVACAGGAAALTPRVRRLARVESRWVEARTHVVLAAFGGAGAATLARTWAELVAFVTLALACAVLVVVDLADHRLPDAVVRPTYPVFYGLLALAAVVEGDLARFGRALLAAVVLTSGFLALALAHRSGLGLGDVKLSGLLGGFLGWFGWPSVLLGTIAAFVLGGVVAVALLATGRGTRTTPVAFGPWLVAGAAVGAAWGPALVGAPLL